MALFERKETVAIKWSQLIYRIQREVYGKEDLFSEIKVLT